MGISTDLFDTLEAGPQQKPTQPFWAIDFKNPQKRESLLKWLNGELQWLMEVNKERLSKCKKNLTLYKGIQYQSQEVRTESRDRNDQITRPIQKIVVNNLYDLTRMQVARLIKYKPAVAIMPTNDEFNDKIASKMTKAWLDHIWYVENFEAQITPTLATMAKVLGESYLYTEWDPEKGDVHKDFEKAHKEYQGKIPLMDEQGNQVLDENGKPKFIEKTIRNGDVDYSIEMPMDNFFHRPVDSCEWDDVEYVFRRRVYDIETARSKWPEQAGQIKAETQAKLYNYEKMLEESVPNVVTVWEFYHKRVGNLDKGAKVCFTKDAVLGEPKDFPYSHDRLPCERMHFIEVPGELHGISFFEQTSPLTGAYNNLTNMILRNQILVCHPKWMMPANAAKIESLGNDITVVRYKGPVAPALVQANATPQEVFAFRKELKEEFRQMSGVYGVSQNQPPPGIKSGIALQFLSEQEAERANEDVLRFNEFIKRVAKVTISVAGDYYDPSDERMVRVLGKNNEYMTVFFNSQNLSKDYDIRIQNSSALPQSKATRTQTMIDLAQAFPGIIPQEQVAELLDLAQPDKFIDLISMSVRAAEAENEQMLTGEEVQEPAEYEHHIQHWQVHAKLIQDWKFKNQTPPEIQDQIKDHIMAHEMFMYGIGLKNEVFRQKLAALDLFPIFFTPPQLGNPGIQGTTEVTQGEPQQIETSPIPGVTSEAQQSVNPADGEPSQFAAAQGSEELLVQPAPTVETQVQG